MIGKCFFFICAVSAVCAVITGNTGILSEAVFEGCEASIELSFSLLGMMCLWCGVMEVFRKAGVVDRLARLLSPILRRVFPESADDGGIMGDIASSVAANMLGVAGAATPFAISAMEKLDGKNGHSDTPCADMVTLAVLGCSSVSLFPTTVITLRHAAGSVEPYAVLVPIWICSAVCTLTSIVLARVTAEKRSGKKKRRIGCGNAFVSRDTFDPAYGRSSYGSEREGRQGRSL